MDRYERLEQIDYKSARDVVTEADHLSEALILDAIRATYPGRRDPRRGDRRASGGRGRGADLGPWPGLDRRPARRHRELRERHPVLLRLDRPGRRRPAGRRGRPRPDARRVVRGRRRRPRHPGRPADPCVGQGQALRLRRLDGAQRTDGDLAGPQRPQGHPHPALDGLGGARARVRRQRPLRRVHPAGRALDVGHRRGRADRGAGRRLRHRDRRRAVVRRRQARPGRSARWPPRSPITRRCWRSSSSLGRATVQRP